MELNIKNPIVFFDLETTGLNIATDRIIEISYLKVWPNGKEESKTRRINPEMPIPAASTAVHGITDADVADCPTFKEVAKTIFIPLTVGGGINTLDDFDRVLKCGADKVSVNSGAIKNPSLIYEAAKRYGDQCVVLSADVKRVDGVFRVFAKGGRENTGMDALEWIKRGVDNGAGEIVLNSIDTDGVKKGFDLEMLKAVSDIVSVPVIASGGAGCAEDFLTLFNTLPKVDAGLAASIFHFGEVKISELKKMLRDNGIPMRM